MIFEGTCFKIVSAVRRDSFIIATWGIKSAWNYYVECDSINSSLCVPNVWAAAWRWAQINGRMNEEYLNEETPADFYTRVSTQKEHTLSHITEGAARSLCARAFILSAFYYLKKAQQQHASELLKSIAAPLSASSNLSNFYWPQAKEEHSVWLDARNLFDSGGCQWAQGA